MRGLERGATPMTRKPPQPAPTRRTPLPAPVTWRFTDWAAI